MLTNKQSDIQVWREVWARDKFKSHNQISKGGFEAVIILGKITKGVSRDREDRRRDCVLGAPNIKRLQEEETRKKPVKEQPV